MSVTRDTSHLERSPLNHVARMNMRDMLVTRDTSQFRMSPLKEFALVNKSVMSVMLDTSHSPIGPCGLLEQSPSGDISRHALTAPLISVLDCGENAAVV